MDKKKKILIIQPTPYDIEGNLIKKSRLYFVGLALPLLAALTPDDFIVELCYETIEDVDFDTDADIIAISSMGHAVIRTIDIAKKFKELGKTVVLGGYMVSIMPDEAIKYCDSVMIGDSEETWPQMLNDYKNNKLKKFYKKDIKKLSTPLPKYEMIINKKIGNFLPVQAGRGCSKACSFCSIYCLYKSKYFKREIDEVVRDIRRVKELGYNQFLLVDDNIFSDRNYAIEFCDRIKSLNMKWMTQCSIDIADDVELLDKIYDSGCYVLSFGLESISGDSLISMNKSWANPNDYEQKLAIIRKHNIDVTSEMVIGADGDTIESIRETKNFIKKNKIVIPRFYILTPFPGTKFYDDMKKENRIYNTDMYTYNACEAVHIPKNMTVKELTNEYWNLYKSLYTLDEIFKRVIFTKEFIKKPITYLQYLYVNLYYRSQILKRRVPNIL